MGMKLGISRIYGVSTVYMFPCRIILDQFEAFVIAEEEIVFKKISFPACVRAQHLNCFYRINSLSNVDLV